LQLQKKSLNSVIALAITLCIFYGLAALHIHKVDIQKMGQKPTTFYKLYKTKMVQKKQIIKKKTKQKKALKTKTQQPKEQLATQISQQKPSEKYPEQETVELAEIEQDVVLIEQIVPDYPDLARKAGLECELFLEVIVDEKGKVADAKVVHCSKPGYGFEKSAVDAVKKTRFKPFVVNGEAIKVKIVYPIRFVLVE
jgi:TonB family protein